MLFTSSYILNHSQRPHHFTLHPFCHSLSNIQTKEGAVRDISVPDVLPSETLSEGLLSMAAGDFLEIYEEDTGGLNVRNVRAWLNDDRQVGRSCDLFLPGHGYEHHRLLGHNQKAPCARRASSVILYHHL